jgi:quercetin dioxygenase-like cupin family protein
MGPQSRKPPALPVDRYFDLWVSGSFQVHVPAIRYQGQLFSIGSSRRTVKHHQPTAKESWFMNTAFVSSLYSLAATLFISTAAMAADVAPDKPIGVSGMTDAVGLVDLTPHNLPGAVGDYDLRSRVVGLAPGGAIHAHPHAGRPGIALVTKGVVVEYRGSTSRTLKPGDTWLETHDTVHWFHNPSNTEVAELWVVDLVPKKK